MLRSNITADTTLLCIHAPALDPIQVVAFDYGPGKGQIIIECYGQAWTQYWGAMGNQTVLQFVATCDVAYLMNKLCSPDADAVDRAYVARIVAAVIHYLGLKQDIPIVSSCTSTTDRDHGSEVAACPAGQVIV